MPQSENPRLVALWVTDPGQAILECRVALAKNNDNVTAAAKELQVSRQALHKWMREHPEAFHIQTAEDKLRAMESFSRRDDER